MYHLLRKFEKRKITQNKKYNETKMTQKYIFQLDFYFINITMKRIHTRNSNKKCKKKK